MNNLPDIAATSAENASPAFMSGEVVTPDSSGPTTASSFIPAPRWLLEGLRAGIFLKPRVAGCSPLPAQMLLVLALVIAVEVAAPRAVQAGPSRFDVQAFLSYWWLAGVFIGLAWWMSGAPQATKSPRTITLTGAVILWLVGALVPELASDSLGAAIARGWLNWAWLQSPWVSWSIYLLLLAWSLAVGVALLVRIAGFSGRTAIAACVLAGCSALTVWQFNAHSWERDYSQDDGAPKRPRLQLSQSVFESQQALLEQQIAALAPQRPGVADVYALVFAPYADEDVFLRESTLASEVLATRFDAEGRVLHLLNHATTTQTRAWATPLNLQRAIAGLAKRMDRDNDVLVVYVTSHGAKDFRLAASHWPLNVDELTPTLLRQALDDAGIRHRVIGISACYSGGWVEPLGNDDTLVMTAADATHTSYGCGRLSELTYFGRAMFDEQLRKTHSFEKAFAAAVPLIKQREIDAGKSDGFSNPQISLGKNVMPVLKALEERLDALSPAGAAPAMPSSGAAGSKTPP
ncbi:MAG: C13 family peptidase [Pseudomonadota bacterium]